MTANTSFKKVVVPEDLERLKTSELRLLLGKLSSLKSNIDYGRVQAECYRRELKSLSTLKFAMRCFEFKNLTSHPYYEMVQAENRRRQKRINTTNTELPSSFTLEAYCKWAY